MFTNPELNLDHPQNINRYYELFFKYHPNVIIGKGFKRTNQYDSLITEQQFLKKRNEFWETQLFGDQNVWSKLKQVLDMDEESAKDFLEVGSLTLIENNIQIVYDQFGNRYQVPIFVINLPISFCDSGMETLNNDFEEKNITFKIRSVRWDNDLVVTFNTKDRVELLIDELKVKENVENVRLFINGKEIITNFGNYNINDESIVQAFLI